MQKDQKDISSFTTINQGADRFIQYIKALSDVELARIIYLCKTEQIIRDCKKEVTENSCPTK